MLWLPVAVTADAGVAVSVAAARVVFHAIFLFAVVAICRCLWDQLEVIRERGLAETRVLSAAAAALATKRGTTESEGQTRQVRCDASESRQSVTNSER